MFLPYRDDNPHTVTPYVNYGFLGLNVLVFLWQASLSPQAGEVAVYAYGFIPGDLFGNVEVHPRVGRLPSLLTMFTSMFMHGGLMHLLGNMMYLWIFGDNVEASLGHKRYALFYLACGAVAALTQGLASPNSAVPMIGASGAVSGVLGAYFILHPRANVRVFVFLLIFITTLNLPAFIVLGIWFVGQLLSSAAVDPSQPGVAFLAHVGGFVAGMALVFFMRRRGVRVFDAPHSRPFAVERRPVRYRRGGSVPRSGPRGPWD